MSRELLVNPMSKVIIRTIDLGKQYHLGKRSKGQYKTFREALLYLPTKIKDKFHPIFIPKQSSVSNDPDSPSGTFWALKDINLEIKQGDLVGIIGRNGAGKSTLLKILSRITTPTRGHAEIYGRIGSLLEVGTGFHPELTGRENIYLNGSILGMKRTEISRKFDEIVAFAEVEKFLDTPIKHFSSGMYVRLAFSVAAHLEPEILLVDEVLAVGDAQFQKKCMGKMDDVTKKEGRTILFVSHNMSAIERLCNSAMIIDKGRITEYSDNTSEIIDHYLNQGDAENLSTEWVNTDNSFPNPYFQPTRFAVTGENGSTYRSSIPRSGKAYVRIEGIVKEESSILKIGYLLSNTNGEKIFISYLRDHEKNLDLILKKGHQILFSAIPVSILTEGQYRLDLLVILLSREKIIFFNRNSLSIWFRLSGLPTGASDEMKPRTTMIEPVIQWYSKI